MRALMILAVFVLLDSLPRHACAQATPDALADLQQLFETDPAAAFEEAARLFEAPRASGDLDGMMAVFGVIVDLSRSPYAYGRLLDDIVDAAAPVARAEGKWEALGRLYSGRAWFAMSDNPNGSFGNSELMYLRASHFVELAEEAMARTGAPPEANARARERLRYFGSIVAKASPGWDAIGGPNWPEIVGPVRAEHFERLAAAFAAGEDSDYVEQVVSLLQGMTPPDGDLDRLDPIVLRVVHTFWLRGGERILSALVDLADAWGDPVWRKANFTDNLAFGCALGWSGRVDAFEQTYWRCLGRLQPGQDTVGYGMTVLAYRLRLFGRAQEAAQLVRQWVAVAQAVPPGLRGGAVGTGLLWPGAPDDLRRALLTLTVDSQLAAGDAGGLCAEADRVMRYGSPQTAAALALEVADVVADAALAFDAPVQRGLAAARAAELYDQAARPDLAARCRDLAAALTTSDPRALLQAAVTSARSQASEGAWDGATKGLEAAVSGAPDSVELLQAAVLLEEAFLRLGEAAEAEKWMAKAKGLVDTLPLAPGEKASYLVTLAELCELAAQAAEGGPS